ncbi:MAG: hypothetical protein ACR5LD_05100 [Symbiopectobacterium sp.]
MLHTNFTWLEGMIGQISGKTLGICLMHNIFIIFVIEINNTVFSFYPSMVLLFSTAR